MSSQVIDLTNIGPIEHFTFQVPEGGGVTVLKGRNGAGKTRALDAVQALTSGRGKVTHRDGAVRGEVDGFGAVLKVARKQTTSGELEVVSLEGRFHIGTLVDPGLVSDDAADAARIKALVQVAGGKGADSALFYDLLGGQENFDFYVSTSATETDDIVTMAARIKRDLEKHARQMEDHAKREVAAAEAARALAGDVDLSLPSDAAALQAELEFAAGEYQRLKTEAAAITQRLTAADTARQQVAAAEASQVGPTLEQAMQAEESARQAAADAHADVQNFEVLLDRARQAAGLADMQYRNATDVVRSAAERDQTLHSWRAAIEAAADVQPIAPELLQQAADDVTAAREALERAAVVRESVKHLSAVEQHMSAAAAHRQKADWLRDAGKATDEVLSDLVGRLGVALRVSGGRLVTDHAKRGETFYSELSMGERTKMALTIATDAVGPNGVIVIAQEFWEGLDPDNRRMVAEHMREAGVVGITAEADHGELRAEVA